MTRRLSEEAKRRIAYARRGKLHTIETRQKIAKAKMKPIVRIEDGKRYDSIGAAAAEMGVSHATVSMMLRGLKKDVKGWHFRYEEPIVYEIKHL